MSGPEEPDSAIIEAARRARESEVRFFSNAGKVERELWVVGEFLTALEVAFSPAELVAPPQADSVDVSFRDARFQVKEIVDPADRRGDRVGRSLQLARKAKAIADLYDTPEAHDIVISDLGAALIEFAAAPKYASERHSLDLLVYVTRPYMGFQQSPEFVIDALAPLGWRSISCLFGVRPLLLVASSGAPAFLAHPQRP